MSSVSSTGKSTILAGRKCFLCQNTRYRSKHCRLFRFPVRGTAMWNRWLTAIDLTEEVIRSNEHPRLCQRHFDPKHFLTRQLSGMAVPVRNLKRIKHMECPPAEEGDSHTSARNLDVDGEHSVVFGSECSEMSDEMLTQCEETEDALPGDSESTNVLVEEQSNEGNATTSKTECAFSCTIPHHKTLEVLLSQERARVERLLKLSVQQKHIIEEQRNLLWQLGVECVTLQSDQLADDSD